MYSVQVLGPSAPSNANGSVMVEHRTLGTPGLLKVLFVTNMYPDDNDPGSGAFVRQQAEHLRKAGHQVDVFHVQNNRSRLNYLTSPFDLFWRTRMMSYDVVHAHYGLSGFPAL